MNLVTRLAVALGGEPQEIDDARASVCGVDCRVRRHVLHRRLRRRRLLQKGDVVPVSRRLGPEPSRRPIDDRPHLFRLRTTTMGIVERVREHRPDPLGQLRRRRIGRFEQHLPLWMYVETFSNPFASKAAFSAGILIRFLPPTLIPRRRPTYRGIATPYHGGVDFGSDRSVAGRRPREKEETMSRLITVHVRNAGRRHAGRHRPIRTPGWFELDGWQQPSLDTVASL